MNAAAVELPAALQEGVLVWDPRGFVVSANEAAARMFGVEPGDLGGVSTDGAVSPTRRIDVVGWTSNGTRTFASWPSWVVRNSAPHRPEVGRSTFAV